MTVLIIIGAIALWVLGIGIAYVISKDKDGNEASLGKLILMSLFISPVLLIIIEELKPYAPKDEIESKDNSDSEDSFWEEASKDKNF